VPCLSIGYRLYGALRESGDVGDRQRRQIFVGASRHAPATVLSRHPSFTTSEQISRLARSCAFLPCLLCGAGDSARCGIGCRGEAADEKAPTWKQRP
jgi:hypothetical protein